MSELETRIKAVIVFRDGARITRVGEERLKVGEQELVVRHLSPYIREDSFRVKGKGPASLLGIAVEKVTEVSAREGKVKELREELKQLHKTRRQLEDEIRVHEHRIKSLSLLHSNLVADYGRSSAKGNKKVETIIDAEENITNLIRNAKEEIRKKQREIEDLGERIDAVEKNIEEYDGIRKVDEFFNVKIKLDVKDDSVVEIELEYQIEHYVGWKPVYDVDLQENFAFLKRIAMVRNQSREDWKDVTLVISTASAQPTRAIEPEPFYIDVEKPPPASPPFLMTKKEAEAKIDTLEMEKELKGFPEAEPPAPEIKEVFAEAKQTIGGITVYEIPGNVTIPSEESPHPITLTEEKLDSKRLYYWNAYAMETAIATEEITNGEATIIPGRAKVFAEGEYLGETDLEMIAPQEEFKLGTRTAHDLRVEKKLIEKETEKAGLTGGKRKRLYRYDLILKNFAKQDIQIEVVDRIPHSSSEKIRVSLIEPNIAYKTFELGILKWKVTIPRSKKTRIEYGFTIEWEKEVNIWPPLP